MVAARSLRALVAFACVLFVSAWAGRALALTMPKITTPVTDDASVLAPAKIEALAKKLVALRDKTGVQMAVLTVRSTSNMPIEDYAMRVAEGWGGGSRDRDDGVLYVLAVADHRMRLEVGYGLEDRIDDGTALTILDGTRDALRDERYAEAIDAVIDAVASRTQDLTPSTPLERRKRQATEIPLLSNYTLAWLAGAVTAFLAYLAIGRRLAAKKARASEAAGSDVEATLEALRGGHITWAGLPLELAISLAAGALVAWWVGGVATYAIGYVGVACVASSSMLVAMRIRERTTREGQSSFAIDFFVIVGLILAASIAGLFEQAGAAGLLPAVGLHVVLGFCAVLVSTVLSALTTLSPGTFSSSGASWSSGSAYDDDPFVQRRSSSRDSSPSSSRSSFWSSSSASSSSSWSSSSSSSSSWGSSSSSSSASSSSWGGGGGSFGGGGASSSW